MTSTECLRNEQQIKVKRAMNVAIKTLSKGLRLFLAFTVALTSIQAVPAFAQQEELDIEGPTIEAERGEAGTLGEAQIFAATVVDNNSVASVSLFYRFDPNDLFIEKAMTPVASSAVYSAKVETEGIDAEQIEYYIQASDEAGNIVLEGFAFSPLTRQLEPLPGAEPAIVAEAPVAPEPVASEPPPAKKKSNVLYYVLGVLAVGAIVAAAGGGSGGDDDDGITPPPECCSVNLTLTTPSSN